MDTLATGRVRPAGGLEACPPRQPGRPSSDAVGDRGYNIANEFHIFHVDLCLKFVRAVRAEDEFELEKNRIDIATGEEKCVVDKVMIVLQPNL
jgi:hypothetical protein